MPGLKRSRAQFDVETTGRPARSFADRSTAAMNHSKRKADGNGPSAKKQRTGGPSRPPTRKYQPKKFSLNPLKTRVRDLRRQLLRSGQDMPANVRVDKERELQACEHELSVAEAERIKQDMIPRFHKARFFERQKATRFLKQAVRRLNDNSDPEKHAELDRERHVCEIDLNYTLYYPLIRPYVFLYARSKDKDEKDGGSKTTRVGGDQEMWELVEKKTKDGTLEALRNGLEWRQDTPEKSAPAASAPGPSEKKSAKGSNAKSAAKQTPTQLKDDENEEGSDDESDGGFFE